MKAHVFLLKPMNEKSFEYIFTLCENDDDYINLINVYLKQLMGEQIHTENVEVYS